MLTLPNFLAFQSDDYATKLVPVTRYQFGCGLRVATKGYGRANPYMTGWKNTGSKMAATESPVFIQGRNSVGKGGKVVARCRGCYCIAAGDGKRSGLAVLRAPVEGQ